MMTASERFDADWQTLADRGLVGDGPMMLAMAVYDLSTTIGHCFANVGSTVDGPGAIEAIAVSVQELAKAVSERE